MTGPRNPSPTTPNPLSPYSQQPPIDSSELVGGQGINVITSTAETLIETLL